MSIDPRAVGINVFINLANILVLFIVLRLLVYRPLRKFMNARAERIRSQMEQAKSSSEAAALLQEGLEKQTRELTDKSASMMEASERDAGLKADEILKDAQDKAAAILDTARQKAEEERRAAIERMRGDIVDMAMGIAQKVLEREVSATDNQRLVDDYFSKVS